MIHVLLYTEQKSNKIICAKSPKIYAVNDIMLRIAVSLNYVMKV